MIERITRNEERFDKILDSVKELKNALEKYSNYEKELKLLKKYYESRNWLKDKNDLEKNKLPKIKAGVLSEDGVWNMLSDIDEIILYMKRIIEDYERNR